jgi:hypothetical protein
MIFTSNQTTTTLAFGGPLTEVAMDAPFLPLNALANEVMDQRAMAVITANTVLVGNRDIFVPVSTAGGNVTITLPSAAIQARQPILIKKVSQDTNTITIQRAGADTIEDPNNPLLSPTATSITMRIPDSGIWLFPVPSTTAWRVMYKYSPRRVGAEAFRITSNQTVTGNFQLVQLNAETYDDLSLYNAGTYQYTVPVKGRYLVSACLLINGGGSTEMEAYVYRNGANAKSIARTSAATTSATKLVGSPVIDCNVGDTLEIRLSVITGSRDVAPGAADSYATYTLLTEL